MPRVKRSEQKGLLDRQRAALAAQLKEKTRKAKAIEREELEHRALVAGRALVAEMDKNPKSPEAAAIRAVLSNRLTKAADREALGLPPLLGKAANQSSPPQAPDAPPSVINAPPPAPAPEQSRGEAAPRGPFDYPKVDPRHAVERIVPTPKPAPPPAEAKREPPAEPPSTGFLGAITRAIQPRPKT